MTINAATHRILRGISNSLRLPHFGTKALPIILSGMLTACGGGQFDGTGQNTGSNLSPGVSGTPEAVTTNSLSASVITQPNYEIDVLQEGSTPYVDRDFQFTDVPPDYEGLCYVQTANEDKFQSNPDFLMLSVNKPVTVYIGYDSRVADIPAWLQSWEPTNDQLKTTGFSGNSARKLYRKDFASGPIVLGGNEMGLNMYTILVEDQDPSTNVPCDIVSNKEINISWLPVSDSINGYRVYYGPNKASTNKVASAISLDSPEFDSQIPAAKFRAWADLGLTSGKKVCFRVSSFNDNAESGLSDAMCATL